MSIRRSRPLILLKEILVFRSQEGHVLLHLRGGELGLVLLLRIGRVVLAWILPKPILHEWCRWKSMHLLALDKGKVRRAKIMQPVVSPSSDQLRVVGGD